MKKIIALLCSLFVIVISNAQSATPWKGKKAAIVITYDDAIDQHLDNAVPLLDSLGLKATFYITGYSSSMQTRINEWKKLSLRGHELGNHTLFHPCIGGTPGREWVKPEYDLSKYSVKRMLDETRATNVLLKAMDGKSKRTFAITCGDSKAGDSSFVDYLKDDFVAIRTVRNEMHPLQEVNLMDVDCFMVNGQTGAQLKEWVDKAIASKSLLVILFHGVGGGNSLNVTLPAHAEFLRYLKKKQKEVWVAPMLQVAEYIQQKQAAK